MMGRRRCRYAFIQFICEILALCQNPALYLESHHRKSTTRGCRSTCLVERGQPLSYVLGYLRRPARSHMLYVWPLHIIDTRLHHELHLHFVCLAGISSVAWSISAGILYTYSLPTPLSTRVCSSYICYVVALIACTRSTFGNGCILSSFFSFILTSH